MHVGNQDWLESLRLQYEQRIRGASILEIGSMDWNGSARSHFGAAARYIGVDHLAGPSVDVVSSAAKTSFAREEFDILICLSLFEHDPEWKDSLEHNLQWVKKGGLIVLCWGAEGNLPHDPQPWAIVPVAAFMEASKRWPIKVIDAFFECDRYTPDCPGCYDVLAVKT